MGLLENKIVLITGASRGIGKSIAEECVKQGAKVAFTYLSSDEKARALEQELTSNGGVAKGFKSDASKYDEAQKLVDDVVEAFGTVDVLGPYQPALKTFIAKIINQISLALFHKRISYRHTPFIAKGHAAYFTRKLKNKNYDYSYIQKVRHYLELLQNTINRAPLRA